MPNISSFGAQTDNAAVQGTVTDRQIVIPDVPPQGLMSIGPRVTPNFVKEPWDKLNSYNFFDAVKDGAGSAYIAIKPVVPPNTELANDEYWFKWSDPNAQLNELEEVVRLYDGRISQNASAIEAEVERATAAEQAEVERATAAEQAEVERATAAEATKAPINHASDETIYGIGNAVNYGHVKLATDDTPATSGANNGVAATPEMVKKMVKNSHAKKLVCIGDSFGDETDGENKWPTYVANGMNASLVNMCKNGAGFGVENNTFLTQIENADFENVTHVVIYGGVNDYTFKTENIITDIIETVRAAKNKFSDAVVLIAPFNVGKNNQARFNDFIKYIEPPLTAANGLNVNNRAVNFIDNAYTWLVPYPTYFKNDKLHPNVNGQHIIANNIISALTGGFCGTHSIVKIMKDEEISNGKISLICTYSNGIFNLAMRTTSAMTFATKGNQDIITGIPSNAFGSDTTIQPYIELYKTENYTAYYLAYSGTIRIITESDNVSVNFSASAVAPCI